MLQSGVAPSAAIQPYQCRVEGSALLLSIGFVQFPQFPCSIYFNRKETDGLDRGAEASVIPPISAPRGFVCGGAGFYVCILLSLFWGFFLSGWLDNGGIFVFRFCLNQKVGFALMARTTLDLHF